MNITFYDNITGRQRCRQWAPLVTQQLRLRHLYQILAYNLSQETTDGFYYTLHNTAMCAPFYTSETVNSANPKWAELEINNIPNESSTAFVIRLWHKSTITLTWGVNLSGLAYLGNKLSEVQPESFVDNTVIFYLRGGYFTGLTQLRSDLKKPLPFIDHLNVVSTEDSTKIFKTTAIKCPVNDIRPTYNVDKLRRLHSLQLSIKKRSVDAQILREKISAKNGTEQRMESDEGKTAVVLNENVRYAPQLLTMTCLNKMLQEKPTRMQKQEIVRMQKEIEITKLKTKILLQERDRMQAVMRRLKTKYIGICDDNEERNSQLMESYHYLSKEIERLREWKREHAHDKDTLYHYGRELQNRRRELLSELTFLYPIIKMDDNKYSINGIYLPSSDMLTDCSEGGLSVALGYVSHILIMCALILQVPLLYPIQHFGSRSVIEDHISPSLSERDREFPLYTRGKDRMQFNYAVYLLNKNIAQYLNLLGARMPNLKETLPNIVQLLQGRNHRHDFPQKLRQSNQPSETSSTQKIQLDNLKLFNTNTSDPILDWIRHECQVERSQSPLRRRAHKNKLPDTGPGLSQILSIPEAFLNQQMSSSTFQSYMKMRKKYDDHLQPATDSASSSATLNSLIEAILPDKSCDKKDENSIEEAKEMVPACSKHEPIDIIKNGTEHSLKKSKRLSRSVGSYTDDESENRPGIELGSDPLLNTTFSTDFQEVSQQTFLQEWLENPALVCSDENLYPEEILGSTATNDSPLTTRTDALLKTKSFNLVRPKF